MLLIGSIIQIPQEHQTKNDHIRWQMMFNFHITEIYAHQTSAEITLHHTVPISNLVMCFQCTNVRNFVL